MSWFRIPPIVLAHAFAGGAPADELSATGKMRVDPPEAIRDALNDELLR